MYRRAPEQFAYADIPIVYVLELGGEEYTGVRDKSGNFTPVALSEVSKTEWQQIESFGPGLGLLLPCIAEFVGPDGKPAGGLTVRILDNKPACASIWAWKGITSSLLRQIPIAALVREAIIPNTVRVLIADKQIFGARYVEGGPGFGQLHEDLQKELAAVDEKAGRRVIDDRFLTEVARVYRDALHDSRTPARAVEDALGPTSPANARRWVAAARRQGFLGPAPAIGRAGELAHVESVSS